MTKRGNNEGSIYKRSDGRWVAVVDLGWQDGKRRRKSIYGRTRKEVADRLPTVLKARQDGMLIANETDKVGEYFNDWLNATKPAIRPRTWERYEQYVRLHIVPTIGKVRLARLTAQHLQRLYTSRLAAGLSPQTVTHLHRVIHAGLSQAVRWDLVPRNVADLVEPPRAIRQAMRTFTPDETRTFLKAAARTPMEALYVLAVTTSMREGELLGLHWRDVDLEVGMLRVTGSLQRMPDNKLAIVEPKTSGSRRQVQLSALGLKALKRHGARQAAERLKLGPDWDDQDLVFPNHVGRPMSQANLLRRDFYPLLESAGLPRIRFHDLRHTAATLLLGQNINTKVVSEMLGHSRVGVTMDLYQHVTPTMQQEAARAFDTLLSDPVAVNLAVSDSDQASPEAPASLLPAFLSAPPDGFEPPTHGLGNRRSIL
jgi:integrase